MKNMYRPEKQVNSEKTYWRNWLGRQLFGIRVTRLGEFLPIGQLLTLGSLLKIIEAA
jgi:hypothetical protein